MPARQPAVKRAVADLTAKVEPPRAALPTLLFKVTDAARIMKVSGSTVRRRIRTGDVPVFKVEGDAAARKARRK